MDQLRCKTNSMKFILSSPSVLSFLNCIVMNCIYLLQAPFLNGCLTTCNYIEAGMRQNTAKNDQHLIFLKVNGLITKYFNELSYLLKEVSFRKKEEDDPFHFPIKG